MININEIKLIFLYRTPFQKELRLKVSLTSISRLRQDLSKDDEDCGEDDILCEEQAVVCLEVCPPEQVANDGS